MIVNVCGTGDSPAIVALSALGPTASVAPPDDVIV